MQWHYKTIPWCAFGVGVLLLAFVPGGFAGELDSVADRARECGVTPEVIYQIEAGVGRGDFSDEEGARILSVIGSSCEVEVPLAPLEAKLLEGLAKRVSPVRIHSALQQLRMQYQTARDLVPVDRQSAKLLVVVGDGLAAGVPSEVFHSYFSAHGKLQPEPLLVGTEMTSLLSQIGFVPLLVQTVVDAGAEAGTLVPQWRYLVQVVLVARQRGLGDKAVADVARDVLARGGELSEVAATLGFTLRDMRGPAVSK